MMYLNGEAIYRPEQIPGVDEIYFRGRKVFPHAYIRYSANSDGTGMTEQKQSNSAYIGYCDMPRSVWENPNLLSKLPDFSV
ncbi:MAG: hypothetical protein ACK5MN_03465, partial [Lachnospiraceae bacterium]